MNRTHALRNLSLSFLLATSVVAATAYAQISVSINIAPPPPQQEFVAAVPPGYVWIPGYWAWHGDRYIWIRGRSVLQPVGYRWEPDRWEQHGGKYYRSAGYWKQEEEHRHGDGHRHGKEGEHRDHDDNGKHKGDKHHD